MGKIIDMKGQRFGRWMVIDRADNLNGRTMWHCRCDCGTEKDVDAVNLRKGLTLSCGCLLSEKMADKQRTHGKRRSRLYNVWSNMKRRCYDEQNISYPYYGGRGITVCDEWVGADGFQHFWDWSYANGYDETAPKGECTLDRIDVNGNYEPSNCRWTDSFGQMRNRTNNRRITIQGITKTLSEWAELYGISESLASDRLNRGWEAQRAFTETPMQMRKDIEYNGETHSYSEWSRILGINKKTIQWRVYHGWKTDEIFAPCGTINHTTGKGVSK